MPAHIQQPFERKEYDVTNTLANTIAAMCGWPCALMNKQQLILEPEEAVLITTTMCDTNTQRRPYGELGSVDKSSTCGCCVGVSSGLGAMQPGCNCEEELVAEIVEELKKRMKTRGDTGQIQRAEQQLTEIMKVQSDMAALNSKVDAILAHLEISAPVPQAMAVPY
mmetsp:Transcript_27047/g.89970  ORF Transcript_27047/g.89970 Transcript_27047/m.89970 type:complete len:166 (+) Transcript_27047:69-566(+)|eukprot:CAMPEP_0196684342 /NCGR_PEP_ID=MMETSP1090-20130531/10490_1 /TAXON_ID=37098 /ORGANISM="Isochrysis sp, Strain CCMP1244" /LENGTH=165 /DNA_ID=CAMNT_0042022821 /DNA_START=68 /DNA_END=565 /DNA_ORIENTATION=-